MIEFDEDGARQYAEKQLRAGANVVLPPPPFNCRVGYQEQYEIQEDGIMVTGVSRFAYDTYRGQTFYSWDDIDRWISRGCMSTSTHTIGRVIRLYHAKEKGEV